MQFYEILALASQLAGILSQAKKSKTIGENPKKDVLIVFALHTMIRQYEARNENISRDAGF